MNAPLKSDIHQTITDTIVSMLEQGVGKWEMPWHSQGFTIPRNAATDKPYRGINIAALWAQGIDKGYSIPLWATFKQWQAIGASVRKGERASLVVFYKTLEIEDEEAEDDETKTIFMARGSSVFNIAQVDGYEYTPAAPKSEVEKIAAAEAFMQASGATIRKGGGKAFYVPSQDYIALPEMNAFKATEHSTAQENYYSTAFHELSHWTGHTSRLNRDFSGRFGSQAYAFEELIAELSAAFLCAEIGITATPREDHAQYLASWLKVLKGDKKAIFTAASKASAAADFLKAKIEDRGE